MLYSESGSEEVRVLQCYSPESLEGKIDVVI